MTISISGLTLNNDLVWLERYESGGVAMSTRRTLGARPVIFVGTLIAGSPITLVATSNMGWLTRTQVNDLLALAAVDDGIYELNFNGTIYQVMFRHTDAPAIEMTPNMPRTTDAAGDFFTGQIKLITV